MAEILGRVERLSTTSIGQQQIAGQTQVRTTISLNYRIFRSFHLDWIRCAQ